MAKKKNANLWEAVQPEDLPVISRFKLKYKGSFKLNPFEYAGRHYRIVGTTLGESDESETTYSIKCVETGEFKDKPESWLLAITKKQA
tara:strand:+ start:505 stop:768 length:264 start_codon:yes stop_codon:yes gene_type:complete